MKSRKSRSSESLIFDVVYEDGTLSSNRKVPMSEIDDLDPERSARAHLLAQDAKIAEASGKSRGAIKTIRRVAR